MHCSSILLCAQETFFTEHIDGEFDLYDVRLRYDLVEPQAKEYIGCTVRFACHSDVRTLSRPVLG